MSETYRKHRATLSAGIVTLMACSASASPQINAAVQKQYDESLGDLFVHFHSNPELSFVEKKTAARIAEELRSAGYEVTEGVGKTGVVALLKNGKGPTVMMRADMDALPVKELTDLPYASRVSQENSEGQRFPVMHACGHDVHITSLVGTARLMSDMRKRWSGTLMLIAQPAEEWKISGAKTMREDGIWKRFGQPDYALAFHVTADIEAGKIFAAREAAYSAVDSVDVVVPGIGAHGASPHRGKDPVVIASQIVMSLQTLVARELSPREPGVVTVGVFKAGNKRNVIGEAARLELTVRSDATETRKKLLDGIERIAVNVGRAAGLPDDRLPTVELKGSLPVTKNEPTLVQRLYRAWGDRLGQEIFADYDRQGMGGEDFPFFTNDPYIPSVYFQVGGTKREWFEAAQNGGPAVASHHSPLFKIAPEPSVRSGVAATVVALMELFDERR
ncbi:MAG: amidohydrolase [Myxococcota bacterium]